MGGRTGARGVDAAMEVARAIAASPNLRLVGVSGYEGSLRTQRTTPAWPPFAATSPRCGCFTSNCSPMGYMAPAP